MEKRAYVHEKLDTVKPCKYDTEDGWELFCCANNQNVYKKKNGLDSGNERR